MHWTLCELIEAVIEERDHGDGREPSPNFLWDIKWIIQSSTESLARARTVPDFLSEPSPNFLVKGSWFMVKVISK
jgi:hypothetical protein